MRTACLSLSVLLVSAAPASLAIVAPDQIMPGDRAGITVTGARPGAELTVEAYRLGRPPLDAKGEKAGPPPLFRASARFRADRRGRVALDGAAPLAGTYAGADARGLFWSGRPVTPAPADVAGLATLAPDEVRLAVRVGGAIVSQRSTRLTTLDPRSPATVERIDTPDLVGVFAAPAGARGRPVVIALHGSEGGSWVAAERQARLFAAHGYATLSLIYFSWPGNGVANGPHAFINLPVERLETARAWLAARQEADTARLGLWGVSKGAEFALLGGATYKWVRAAVACVPSSLVWGGFGGDARGQPGFTVGGRAPGYVPYGDYGPVLRGEITSTERHRRDRAAATPATIAAATIAAERGPAHLLLLSGDDDAVWPSSAMSREIVARRSAALRPTQWLAFASSGHFVCGTGDDVARDAAGDDRSGGGGSADATERAAGKAWDATLAFLARHLG